MYCNFHFTTSLRQKDELLLCIKKEIELSNAFEDEEIIETIYFGGGTPGILEVEEITVLLEAIRKKFRVVDDAEITLEANPDDVSIDEVKGWKMAGITRFSLGLQTFDEAELLWMNRAHDATKAMQSIDEIKAVGYNNFSVDLIYGSPMQTEDILKNNLDIILAKKIPHISAYALTVEEGTLLKKNIDKKLSPAVNEDEQAERFALLVDTLTAAGYEQYEISNFAIPGFESRHNSNYWKGIAYYGFGPSAHSYNGHNKRSWNVANNAKYITAIQQGIIPAEEELLSVKDKHNEFVMLGLRTSKGISLQQFAALFGEENCKHLHQNLNKYLQEGLVKNMDGNIILSSSGKFLADGIAAALFI